MSSQGLNSLATIIKRLEAATSRLEDLAVVQSGGALSFPEATAARPASTIISQRPTSPPPQAKAGSIASEAAPDAVPASIAAYDERIINGKLSVFLEQTKGLGQAKLEEQAKLVASLFQKTRSVLLCATACMKPSDTDFAALMAPIHATFNAVTKIKDESRSNREWSLHFQTISDGAGCVGWVQAPSSPAEAVKEQKEAAEFYANRVISTYKEKDKKHVDWARSYIALIEELRKYVLEYHKMGLIWNPKGGKATEFSLESVGGAPGKSSAPLPPPPPPPPPPLIETTPPPASSGGAALTGTAAVFAQLNQGMDITKGLRKVEKSEMTHKNPSLRVSSTVPARSPSPSPTSKQPPKPKKPVSLQAKKPPKKELQGGKWIVEHYENDKEIVLDDVSISQVVALYGCKNCVVQVKGKINGVTMTNCQKTSIVIDSTISVISITNCQSFQLQILGTAPTIQIETTDFGQVFLSETCLGAEIITAKCSAINISIPTGSEGDFSEKPVPEMLRTVIQDGKLVSSIVEHSG
ncbi:hypothetical protein FRC20_010512 [Serendipita sp. 405]|nr:hypothetical protein FRC20_010512 [Serendipita sp. 405]